MATIDINLLIGSSTFINLYNFQKKKSFELASAAKNKYTQTTRTMVSLLFRGSSNTLLAIEPFDDVPQILRVEPLKWFIFLWFFLHKSLKEQGYPIEHSLPYWL